MAARRRLTVAPGECHGSASRRAPSRADQDEGPIGGDTLTTPADVAELVDARRSGRRGCMPVEVRVLSSAWRDVLAGRSAPLERRMARALLEQRPGASLEVLARH